MSAGSLVIGDLSNSLWLSKTTLLVESGGIGLEFKILFVARNRPCVGIQTLRQEESASETKYGVSWIRAELDKLLKAKGIFVLKLLGYIFELVKNL